MASGVGSWVHAAWGLPPQSPPLSLPTTLFLLKPFLVMQAAMLEATIHGCPYGKEWRAACGQ